jgi:hypothetical protein
MAGGCPNLQRILIGLILAQNVSLFSTFLHVLLIHFFSGGSKQNEMAVKWAFLAAHSRRTDTYPRSWSLFNLLSSAFVSFPMFHERPLMEELSKQRSHFLTSFHMLPIHSFVH